MAVGGGINFDASSIRQADEAIKKLVKNAETGIEKVNKAWKDMTKDGLNHFIQRIGVAQRAISNLSNARVNVRFSGQANDLKRLGDSASRAIPQVNKLITAMQQLSRLNINIVGSRGGGSPTAMDTQKIKYLQDQIKLLEKQLKLQQDISKALGNQVKGTNNVRNSMNGLGDTARKVRQIAGTIFSVQALIGFGNKLLQIRGEFEMQHRSLQVLLQDVDKANELWNKTVSLAVNSPFRIKELVTYTKQLAAYRVEADKLYETNRMLADVSAGLGVDMDRLILAFGQVKAASFLRGTELRQFTEAGIPMLEELAKYFTELEGRAVSVGDVFERISKRMVSFTDVEEVFKRITSEGGIFYRMQEIQAETLRGQISNLKDSVDIMFNDIGKSYDSTLKNMVSLTKSLVDNWRTVSSIVIPIVGALVARWGIFKITTTKNGEAITGFAKTFRRQFEVVITQLTRGTRVAKQFAKSTQVSIMGGWSTVILTVVAALTILVKTIQNANRVKRELEKLDLSGAFDASRSVAEYKRLANVVSDTSKSYDEQQKALSTLKAKYQDILPSHLLEQDTIKALKGNYEEATTAIYDYIAAKTKEKQIEVIQTEYGSAVEEQAGDLTDDIKKALARVAPNITRADVLPIVNKLQELIQLGDVNVLNVDEVIQNLVRQFTGLEISSSAWKYTFSAANGEMVTLENNAESLINAMGKMKQAMNEVTSSSLSWQDSFIYQDFNRVKDGYEKQSEAIGKYYDTIRKYEQEREEKSESEVSDELTRDYEAAVESLNKIFDEANQKAPEWSTIINEPFKLNEATINANKILWQKMIGEINTMPIIPNQVGAKQNYVELLEEQMEGFAGTKKQQEVARVAQDLANTMRVSLEGLDELFLKSDESLSDYAKRISGTLEQYKTSILQFDTDIQNGTKFGDYTKDQVDLMRSQVPFLKEFLKLFAAFLAPKKSTKAEDTFTPMLRSVKEIYSEFKKLQGSFDELTAKEGALAKFGDAFKEAFGKTPEQMGFDLFSEEGVKAAYDYLISKAPDAKKKIQAQLAKGEIVWDVKLQTKKDVDKKLLDDIQELFDQYDLSLELKKLNVPPDLAKSLFGIDTINLSDIREKVESELDKAKSAGGQEDRVKQLEEDLEKVNDMEDKAQIERLKTYLQYTRAAIGERAKIKVEEMTKLQEIDETFTKAMNEAKTEEDKKRIAEQKKLAEEGVRREASEKTYKLDWEDFKVSDTFINLFDDLDNASSDLINHAITQIEKFKTEWTDMPVESAKEMALKLNDLQLALMDTDKPLKDNKKLWKELGDEMEKRGIKGRPRDARAQAALTEQVTSENKDYEVEIEMANKRVAVLETINNLNAENKTQELEKIGYTKEYVETLGLSEKVLTNTVEANNDLIKNEKTSIKGANEKIAVNRKILNTQKKISQNYKELNDAIGTSKKLANDLYNSFKELTEVLGGDGPAMIFADMGMSMANTVLDTIMLIVQLNAATIAAEGLGVAMKSASGIIGWIVMAIELIVQAITAAVNYAEKMRQMKLDILADQVDNLKKKYDSLAESIENAWSYKQLEEYSKELDKVQKKMISAQKQYVQLLRSGKGAEKIIATAEQAQRKLDAGFSVDDLSKKERKALLSEEYQDYKDATEALAEMQKEYEEQKQDLLNELGGVTDPKEAAEDFVDAWLDAYKETGDGLSGLDEKFDEFFENLIKKKAAMYVAEKALTGWIKAVNNALDKDSEGREDITKEEQEAINKAAEDAKEKANRLLLGIFEGMDFSDADGLSGLQKGIQGITEQQAEILTAYWNSVRGYTASIDSKMDLILANMGVGSENNPMLEQLRSQTGYLMTIKDVLSGASSFEARAIWVKLAGQN